ncbi:putative MFS multidrug transporter [Saccharata proteae CBS 121410]|uniref:MFS multidrug transporter n=1 Tax=Saccharata proteae CBS 121410 TaxID=1314787 RepID=A0A9P4HXE6_9PEZI|nr:putative MFS multidrug transporter [Saccharata proteae CBS 121410]
MAAERQDPSEASPLLQPSSNSSVTATDNAPADEKISVYRGVAIVASLGVIMFLQACNFSLLTTTQSAIAVDLDAFEKASWFTSAYLVPMSSITPLAGRLSQIFSPRTCIFVASILFSAGGLVAAFATSLTWFLTGRALTGVGGAGILSIAIIIVLQVAGHKNRGLYLGCINTIITSGVSLGAVLGGAIEPRLGWRAVFWLQTPFAVAAGICIFFSIPHTLGGAKAGSDLRNFKQKLAQIDYLGAVTLTGSITSLLLALAGRTILILPLILFFVLLATFILTEVYVASDPIVPVTILKSRGTLFTCLATVGFMMARWSVLFYTPVYAIAVRGWAPAAAGSILIPTNAGFGSGGLLAGWLHIRRPGSFYLPTLISMTLFPLTLLSLAFTSTASASPVLYVLCTFLNGLTTGAAINYTLVHALHLTPSTTHFIVTSLIATFRGFAGSFGSAVGGGIFGRLLRHSLNQNFAGHGLKGKAIKELIRRLTGSPALVAKLEGVEREVAVQGYEDALRGLFLAMVGLSLVMVFVQAATGWRGYDEKENTRREREEEEAAGAVAA